MKCHYTHTHTHKQTILPMRVIIPWRYDLEMDKIKKKKSYSEYTTQNQIFQLKWKLFLPIEIGITVYLYSFKEKNGDRVKMKYELKENKTSETLMAGTLWPIVWELQIQMGSIPWHSRHAQSRQQLVLSNQFAATQKIV